MANSNIKKYLPVIIGTLLSIPLAIGAFFLTQGAMTRASVSRPENVKVTAIEDTKAVITWTTDQEVQGVVEYGTAPNKLNTYAPEVLPKVQHRIELTLLTPDTPYYFKIRIGDELYDNEGLAWTFRTDGRGEAIGSESETEGTADGEGNNTGTAIIPTLAIEQDTTLRLPTPAVTTALQQQVAKPTAKPLNCPQTRDCERIKALLGTECTVTEYVTCMKKNTNVQGASTQNGSTQKKPSKPKATSTPKPTLALPENSDDE